MRIYIRGGLWTNAEDEILKASIMKYGLRNWARVASLFPRKSAKQCKARWFEWLDPTINKTPWSREEEEKLLYLAKAMPMQWRSIAPMVGRTPSQCLEHYNTLLSRAAGVSQNDRGRLRAGEMDPNPESKPAKPDAIDMTEDEVEALAEARARLANTKGKKDRRRARERRLAESRRLATLQKRRELVAAGIAVPGEGQGKKRRKKKDAHRFDLVNEVPFHTPVPRGLFAVPQSERPVATHADLVGKTVRDVEGMSAQERELLARERDIKRQKLATAKDPTSVLLELAKSKDLTTRAVRAPLLLPPPLDPALQPAAPTTAASAAAAALQQSSSSSSLSSTTAGSAEQPLFNLPPPKHTIHQPKGSGVVAAAAPSRFSLADALAALPKPKNNTLQVVIPEIPNEEDEAPSTGTTGTTGSTGTMHATGSSAAAALPQGPGSPIHQHHHTPKKSGPPSVDYDALAEQLIADEMAAMEISEPSGDDVLLELKPIAPTNESLDALRKFVKSKSKAAAKDEKKANTLCAGLMARVSTLDTQIATLAEQIMDAQSNLGAYRMLAAQEESGIQTRTRHLQHLVSAQTKRSTELQALYANVHA